jgi:hypothetical protein
MNVASLSGFGEEYEKKIGRKRATDLAEIAGVIMPRVGYQVTLVEVKGDLCTERLYLQNVGGQFVLASSSRPVIDWDQVFQPRFKKGATI